MGLQAHLRYIVHELVFELPWRKSISLFLLCAGWNIIELVVPLGQHRTGRNWNDMESVD